MPDEFVDLEYDQQRLEASRGVLELAVRQLRSFARCITGNRSEADELVEDTLMLFLAEDRFLREAGSCFAELLSVFRRVHARSTSLSPSRTPPEPQYAALMQLSLAEREMAALCMGAGISACQAGDILEIPSADAEALFGAARARLQPSDIPEWPFTPAPIYDAPHGKGSNNR